MKGYKGYFDGWVIAIPLDNGGKINIPLPKLVIDFVADRTDDDLIRLYNKNYTPKEEV